MSLRSRIDRLERQHPAPAGPSVTWWDFLQGRVTAEDVVAALDKGDLTGMEQDLLASAAEDCLRRGGLDDADSARMRALIRHLPDRYKDNYVLGLWRRERARLGLEDPGPPYDFDAVNEVIRLILLPSPAPGA